MVYEPEVGELFAGRYRVEAELGRGAAGSVWAALDEGVGDRVALKLLAAGADDAAERFRREVRLARRVTHRNAARIFDLGVADGVLYLTMELVDGESLKETLSRHGRLPVARATEIARQIALGLAAAHDVEVVHRDVKPANVLLERSGRVVITDFGVARAVAGDAELTVGTMMIGSPAYMAPEQVRGDAVGPATDLYALGALLYEMLTGTCPFVRDTAVATAMARLREPPPDPRRHAALPEGLAHLVLGLLSAEPESRPESARSVAQALAELGRESPPEEDQTLVRPADTAAGTALRTAARPAPSHGWSSRASSTASPTASGSRSATSTFVTIAPEERTLAVLPFRYRGPGEHDDLAEALGEDIVDVLAATRGVRVTASGATAKYVGQAVDPREAGRDVGAAAIVEGSMRIFGERARISARLIDVDSGEQLWVDRFDLPLDDALEHQEATAQRIAESLRLELEILGARHQVPEEAIDLLIAARRRAAAASASGADPLGQALELLDRALERAPDFPLAVAIHALFAVRRWFLPADGDSGDIARVAHDSVARALEQAPHSPWTHFAAGRLAVSDGRFDDAASELTLALSLAPTLASAHGYLGMLQCEAGRGDAGERHILLARRIDPSQPMGPSLARRYVLEGDLEAYRASLEEMKATPEASRFMVESLEMRIAGWLGDLDGVRRCNPAVHLPQDHDFRRFVETQRAALLGECTVDDLLEGSRLALSVNAGPRLDLFVRQLLVEALMRLGDRDRSLAELRAVAETPTMVDADWMERCPALDPLRNAPDFADLAGRVRRRADALWRTASL